MKKICCVLLAMLPLTAFAYPIDVEKELNGLKIDYTTYDTDYDMGSISVNNYGDIDAELQGGFQQRPGSAAHAQDRCAAGKRTKTPPPSSTAASSSCAST